MEPNNIGVTELGTEPMVPFALSTKRAPLPSERGVVAPVPVKLTTLSAPILMVAVPNELPTARVSPAILLLLAPERFTMASPNVAVPATDKLWPAAMLKVGRKAE